MAKKKCTDCEKRIGGFLGPKNLGTEEVPLCESCSRAREARSLDGLLKALEQGGYRTEDMNSRRQAEAGLSALVQIAIASRDINTLRDVAYRNVAHSAYPRGKAIDALADLRDEGSVDFFLQFLNAPQYSDYRRNVVIALGKLKAERAIPTLINELWLSSEANEAVTALAALGACAVGPLVKVIHGAEELNGVALEAKDAVAPKGNLDHLGRRERALLALAKIEDPQAVDPLLEALLDDDILVQSSAATSLGKIRDPRAIAPLVDKLCHGAVQAGDCYTADGHSQPEVSEGVGRRINGDAVHRKIPYAAEALIRIGSKHEEQVRSALAERGDSTGAWRKAIVDQFDRAGQPISQAALAPAETSARNDNALQWQCLTTHDAITMASAAALMSSDDDTAAAAQLKHRPTSRIEAHWTITCVCSRSFSVKQFLYPKGDRSIGYNCSACQTRIITKSMIAGDAVLIVATIESTLPQYLSSSPSLRLAGIVNSPPPKEKSVVTTWTDGIDRTSDVDTTTHAQIASAFCKYEVAKSAPDFVGLQSALSSVAPLWKHQVVWLEVGLALRENGRRDDAMRCFVQAIRQRLKEEEFSGNWGPWLSLGEMTGFFAGGRHHLNASHDEMMKVLTEVERKLGTLWKPVEPSPSLPGGTNA